MVEQQEDDNNGHERSQCQRAACRLLAFKLPAVLQVIAFGQLYLTVYPGLYVVHHAAQVAVGHVGGNHNLTLHVLAADGVRSHGRADFRYITQGDFLPVARINHQIAYFLHLIAKVVLDADGEVEALPLLVNL